MSVETDVRRWAAPARRRAALRIVAVGAPLVLAAVAGAWRLAGPGAAMLAGLALAALIGWTAMRRARRHDRAWLVAALDAARGDLEDSSDLLFAEPEALGPLQRLQRDRLRRRLGAAPPPDLADAWPWRAIALAVALGLAIAAAALLWPAPREKTPLAPAREGGAAAPGIPHLTGQRLTVVPPAYTGLPPRALDTLDARVPEGSRLAWRLRFDPAPAGAAIVSPGGGSLSLRTEDGEWRAGRMADRAFLYRVVPQGGRGTPPLHRIDVIADQPPRIRVIEPARTLTMIAPGQRAWRLGFAVTDDYGVAATARLRIVLAQGEGENVAFRERTITLTGAGGGRDRRFAASLDLRAAGFTEAGDMVAQLIVADTRGHVVRGPSLILRRPPAALGESGLEASVRRQMPAYFRSQRQIIIDAEALLAARPRPAPAAFLARSDTIGADQRLLRLRYGQFMGEETGGGATNAMPTNDAEEGAEPAHQPGDGHDHEGEMPTPPKFGDMGDVTAEYGHTHDESEAATLLDPGTRATLRQALDAMWQSELALRQGDPRRALPHAYRALRFIKQVQQATRIFLARTGTQLPPVDEGRRLTGKRDGIGRPPLPALAARPQDAVAAAAWRALGEGEAPDLGRLSGWLAANTARVPDPLALTAAIDAVRRQPDCDACRQRLRGVLWSALARPAPTVTRRPEGGAMGRRYRAALR